jgi:hypothetical protein
MRKKPRDLKYKISTFFEDSLGRSFNKLSGMSHLNLKLYFTWIYEELGASEKYVKFFYKKSKKIFLTFLFWNF